MSDLYKSDKLRTRTTETRKQMFLVIKSNERSEDSCLGDVLFFFPGKNLKKL